MADKTVIGGSSVTASQLKELFRQIAEGGISGDVIQRFLDHKNPWAVQTAPQPETTNFTLVKTFDIVVPADYQHGTQLQSFRKKHGKSLYYFNDNLTDDNFSKVSAQLKPRQKVMVNVYRQTTSGSTTSDERMTFLRALPGNKFYSAQGASLVYEQKADQLEKGLVYAAMDEKDNLPFVDGRHRVPYWHRYSDGGYYFFLGYFEGEWNADDLLFSFSDAE
jgi:hypothetical protein